MTSAVRDFAKSHPDHDVIRGGGFARSVFDETGPTKELLDAVVSDRAVYIVSGDGHSA